MKEITISAAIITDEKGRLLLVRKRGTHYFMQPGGKPEAGESSEAALIRELKEELNFIVSTDELIPMGCFSDIAANEPNHVVSADVYRIATDRACFEPTAEIEEVIWFEPKVSRRIKLAPLTENHILPLLEKNSDHG